MIYKLNINMRNILQTTTFLTLICLLVISSCNYNNDETIVSLNSGSETSSSGTTTNSPNNVIFKYQNTIFRKSDLPAAMREAIYKNDYETYSKNLKVYKEYALRLYLAKKQNMLKDPRNPPNIYELLKTPNISDRELKDFYKKNKNRMPHNVSFDKMKGQLQQYLKNQKVSVVFREKLAEMEGSGQFKSLVVPPQALKVVLDTTGFPVTGNKDAKIKIIEISDYLCGHCQNAHPMVQKILKQYKDKISFTQMNFALRPDGLSGTYVRGGYCAQKQGIAKFWTYHDQTFKTTAVPHEHKKGDVHTDNDGNSKGSLDKVTDVAKKVGLNIKEFSKCLQSSETINYIRMSNKMMSDKGISGTPVFIINNKKLARGVIELEKAIDNLL